VHSSHRGRGIGSPHFLSWSTSSTIAAVVPMDFSAIAREFPQFGKSIANIKRPVAETFDAATGEGVGCYSGDQCGCPGRCDGVCICSAQRPQLEDVESNQWVAAVRRYDGLTTLDEAMRLFLALLTNEGIRTIKDLRRELDAVARSGPAIEDATVEFAETLGVGRHALMDAVRMQLRPMDSRSLKHAVRWTAAHARHAETTVMEEYVDDPGLCEWREAFAGTGPMGEPEFFTMCEINQAPCAGCGGKCENSVHVTDSGARVMKCGCTGGDAEKKKKVRRNVRANDAERKPDEELEEDWWTKWWRRNRAKILIGIGIVILVGVGFWLGGGGGGIMVIREIARSAAKRAA
jgi:hypothetical protein